VVPVRYSLHLIPFIIPDNFSLEGTVDIQVEVAEATATLTLHIKDLDIREKDVYVANMDGGLIPVIHTQLFITLNVDQWSTC
jgi:hypothetical protein